MLLKNKLVYLLILIVCFQFCTLLVNADSQPEDVIYIKDYEGDNGDEPSNPPYGVFWQSPDIEAVKIQTGENGEEYLEIFCTIHPTDVAIKGATRLTTTVFWSPQTTNGFGIGKDEWRELDAKVHPFTGLSGKIVKRRFRAASVEKGDDDFDGIMALKGHVCLVVELKLEKQLNGDKYDKYDYPNYPNPNSIDIRKENNMAWRNVSITEYDCTLSSFKAPRLWSTSGEYNKINLEVTSSSSRWECKLIDDRLQLLHQGVVYGIKEKKDVTPDNSNEAQLVVSPKRRASDTEISVIQRVDGKIVGGVTYKIRMPKLKRYDIGLFAGIAFSNDTIDRYFTGDLKILNPSISLRGDLSYHFTRELSLIAYTSYNVFKSELTGIADDYLINISANLKYRLLKACLSPYINGGIGYYIPKTGESGLGANFGAGFIFDFNKSLSLEFGADYHHLFNEDLKFINSHAGIIFRF
jgi:hypothetical protein